MQYKLISMILCFDVGKKAFLPLHPLSELVFDVSDKLYFAKEIV